MTTRLDCADLGYSCDWTTADHAVAAVVERTVSHLRDEHRVDADSAALRTYVEGYAREPNGARGQPSSPLPLPAPVARATRRYRNMPMAGRASIAVVSIAALLMVALLYRTQTHTAAIQDKAALIAQSGRGINENTDSLMQLDKTNKLTADIQNSLSPLNQELLGIASLSRSSATNLKSIRSSSSSIEGSSNSIDTSTGAVDQDVGAIADVLPAINTSLNGINANAADILAIAESLERGISLIGTDLSATADVASQILHDATGIHSSLQTTRHYASCIDNGLNGGGHCRKESQP
jgi:predicted small metal-binding protein/uncharacterized protein YoxC